MEKSHYSFQNILLLAALTIIWGTSYILIKKGLLVFTPTELACLRIAVSCLATLPLAWRAFKTIPRASFCWVLIIGLCGSGIPAFMFAISVGKIGSSVNGIINSLSPLFTLLVGAFFFEVVAGRLQTIGVLTGLVGAFVLVAFNENGNWNVDYQYALLPVVGTLCYGISSNVTKQKMQSLSPIYSTTLAMQFIGWPAVLVLFSLTNFSGTIHESGFTEAFSYVVLLSVFGTAVAWSLFYRLVQNSDALFAASVTYLIPVVAIMWGLADGEKLNTHHFIGLALILLGVYFVSRKK